ncbi:MAG: BON domain-containing protein [Gemmatimonadaceae bacterium]|nr:BON domain-containing protein [Gemmatimonadaceae bacterium]
MSTPHESHDRSTPGSQIASILVGGALGVGVGLVLAQTLGGTSGIATRLSRRTPTPAGLEPGFDADDEEPDDPFADAWERSDDDADDTLGERVLEAFANDPILSGRAVDIEAHPGAAVELSGSVDTLHEIAYAGTLAGGVPGVDHVINRLRVDRNA